MGNNKLELGPCFGPVLDLVLGWPVSVNHLYVKIPFKTKEGRIGVRQVITAAGQEWKQKQIAGIREQMENAGWSIWEGPWFPQGTFVSVGGVVREPDKRRRDLDNLFKLTWDTIQEAEVLADDSQIRLYNRVGFGPLSRKEGKFLVRVERAPQYPLDNEGGLVWAGNRGT